MQPFSVKAELEQGGVYASGSFMMYLFCLINRHLQRIFWTIFHTLKAKNTFCAILSFSRIICNINFHWTHFFTFTTRNTFTFITFDSEQRKITHRFQKYCDRTYVFAKCTIILKGKSQYYPNCIVYDISNDNTQYPFTLYYYSLSFFKKLFSF